MPSRYRRALVKLSGEALMGQRQFSIAGGLGFVKVQIRHGSRSPLPDHPVLHHREAVARWQG
ncbi:hypothetical protein J0H33_12440 [bacterium]|nr:hypothetical protein [bacterium]